MNFEIIKYSMKSTLGKLTIYDVMIRVKEQFIHQSIGLLDLVNGKSWFRTIRNSFYVYL